MAVYSLNEKWLFEKEFPQDSENISQIINLKKKEDQESNGIKVKAR